VVETNNHHLEEYRREKTGGGVTRQGNPRLIAITVCWATAHPTLNREEISFTRKGKKENIPGEKTAQRPSGIEGTPKKGKHEHYKKGFPRRMLRFAGGKP